jgi:hypothetical protein
MHLVMPSPQAGMMYLHDIFRKRSLSLIWLFFLKIFYDISIHYLEAVNVKQNRILREAESTKKEKKLLSIPSHPTGRIGQA